MSNDFLPAFYIQFIIDVRAEFLEIAAHMLGPRISQCSRGSQALKTVKSDGLLEMTVRAHHGHIIRWRQRILTSRRQLIFLIPWLQLWDGILKNSSQHPD